MIYLLIYLGLGILFDIAARILYDEEGGYPIWIHLIIIASWSIWVIFGLASTLLRIEL